MKLSDYINLTIEEVAKGAKKADATLKDLGNGSVLTKGTQLSWKACRLLQEKLADTYTIDQ